MARDVEQTQLLQLVHLLVDRHGRLEVARLNSSSTAAPRTRRPAATAARTPDRCGLCDVMPDRITIGNSSPLAAWIVITRTASASVSGSTASATRNLLALVGGPRQ